MYGVWCVGCVWCVCGVCVWCVCVVCTWPSSLLSSSLVGGCKVLGITAFLSLIPTGSRVRGGTGHTLEVELL